MIFSSLFFVLMTRQKKLQLSGIITAPLCKGSSAAGGEGLFFFTTLQPLRGFQTPLGEACKRAAHTRKSLQPLRGFRTPLGDACKRASHTCKSLPPLRGPPPLTHGRRIPNPSRPCLQALSQTEKTSPALSRGRGFFSFYISVLLILDSCLCCTNFRASDLSPV